MWDISVKYYMVNLKNIETYWKKENGLVAATNVSLLRKRVVLVNESKTCGC
jgi:hypothetical protein